MANAMPTASITRITKRYLSIYGTDKKTIYLLQHWNKHMSKILELIGFALIGGTIISFVGMMNSPLRWPVFWGCAGGALAVILYRKAKRKQKAI